MNKKIFLSFLWFFGFFLALSILAQAQSTLEYTTLTTAVGAAASKAKGEESKGGSEEGVQTSGGIGASGVVRGTVQKVYGAGAEAMSKSASLFGQAGTGIESSGQTKPVEVPETTASLQETKMSESENKESPPQKLTKEEKPAKEMGKSSAKIFLKNGSVIEGNILEHKDDYIKVDTAAIPVTYFKEEIERIEEAP